MVSAQFRKYTKIVILLFTYFIYFAWFNLAFQQPYVPPYNFTVLCWYIIAPTLIYTFYYFTLSKEWLNANDILRGLKANGKKFLVSSLFIYLFPLLAAITFTYIIYLLPVLPTKLWANLPLKETITISDSSCSDVIAPLLPITQLSYISQVTGETFTITASNDICNKILNIKGNTAIILGKTWTLGSYITDVVATNTPPTTATTSSMPADNNIKTKVYNDIINPPNKIDQAIKAPIDINYDQFNHKTIYGN